MVAATLIAAPSSTKKARQQRDPERPQTKKGNQWPFGMKAHRGTDAPSGWVPTVRGTAAQVAASAQTHELLPGEEKPIQAAAGYRGVDKRAELVAQGKEVQWQVAAKRGPVQAMAAGVSKELTQQLEKRKAQVRARVEHPLHLSKHLLRYRKTRDRGLAQNTAQLHSLLALANLMLAKRSLLRTAAACAPTGNAGNSPETRWNHPMNSFPALRLAPLALNSSAGTTSSR